jgi:predicted ribosomally synthesized peptide with nif11-like leader
MWNKQDHKNSKQPLKKEVIMSNQSARSFLERFRTDQNFSGLFSNKMTGEERIALVKSQGYDCTKEELNQALLDSELSEKDLDRIAAGNSQVSGDGSCPDCWWW